MIDLKRLTERTEPEHTVLLFGAGSSIPSGAPTAAALADFIALGSGLPTGTYNLAEVAGLVEARDGRNYLVRRLREALRGLTPTRGLLTLPDYTWKSLFTTNFDTLIEQAFAKVGRPLTVFSSNFDFTTHGEPSATKLFKLHGSIEHDLVDGHVSRLALTEADLDHAQEYREKLFDRLKGDVAGGHLIIIGHSLADEHIRELVKRAAELKANAGVATRISLLLYERDENRAALIEGRGFEVAFGGIDDFFALLASTLSPTPRPTAPDQPLDAAPALRPITLDLSHAATAPAEVSGMYNGWPATYANIRAGQTFERSVASAIEAALSGTDILCAVLLGASGTGKTTAARQALDRLRYRAYFGWEHVTDHSLPAQAWLAVARWLSRNNVCGALLVDEAHTHLYELNDLLEHLVAEGLNALRVIAVSSRNQWGPRIKTPVFFKRGRLFKMTRLNSSEIESLLTLVEVEPRLRQLVEGTFSGFSRHERRRRLVDRCSSETFVCLRNIFSSEKFDDIILREYAALSPECQDVYRHVAALESSGVTVHRQMLIRLLGLDAEDISSILSRLEDIVHEYTIRREEGLFGWRGRHQVISGIVARYKFANVESRIDLFARVIDNIAPTYDLEIRSLRDLCNVDDGLRSIPSKATQNMLLRKMMSAVPGERVPRHRLIKNLISMGEHEKAETEIRIFEKDFRRDGPVSRYKVTLLKSRALTSPGLLEEDRLALLDQARSLAAEAVIQFPYNKVLLNEYCSVGVEIFRRTGSYAAFDAAISEMRAAEERIGDPEIGRSIGRFQASIGTPEPLAECEYDEL